MRLAGSSALPVLQWMVSSYLDATERPTLLGTAGTPEPVAMEVTVPATIRYVEARQKTSLSYANVEQAGSARFILKRNATIMM